MINLTNPPIHKFTSCARFVPRSCARFVIRINLVVSTYPYTYAIEFCDSDVPASHFTSAVSVHQFASILLLIVLLWVGSPNPSWET